MDKVKWRHYLEMYFENQPNDTPLTLDIAGIVTIVSTVGQMKDILGGVFVTIPALRNALDEANNALKALQEQTPENKMDTVLKRALHYLELHAGHYHSSGADEVVMELRQLIETEYDQIKGETLSFEPSPWEYYYTPFNPSLNYINHFNKKGADCWELVHCDFEKGTAIFKRPK